MCSGRLGTIATLFFMTRTIWAQFCRSWLISSGWGQPFEQVAKCISSAMSNMFGEFAGPAIGGLWGDRVFQLL